jgi:hypothetical protein
MGSQVAAAESLEAPRLKYRTDLSSEQKQTVRCDASAPAECEGHRLIAFEDLSVSFGTLCRSSY